MLFKLNTVVDGEGWMRGWLCILRLLPGVGRLLRGPSASFACEKHEYRYGSVTQSSHVARTSTANHEEWIKCVEMSTLHYNAESTFARENDNQNAILNSRFIHDAHQVYISS
jgi:hypothetical protein